MRSASSPRRSRAAVLVPPRVRHSSAIASGPVTETTRRGGDTKMAARVLDDACLSSPGAVLCGFYGVHTDKIYRRIGGFRVVVRQKLPKRGISRIFLLIQVDQARR